MFPSSSLWAVVSTPFKRSQLGLFQGKTKLYGNSVPNSKHKTRRTWLPNIHSKRLFSDSLQQFIRVKLTARALKTVKKHGSLDNYLLKTKADLLGWEGMRLRVMVRDKMQGVVPAEEVTKAVS
ncbi:hypothetical protein C8Q80DRAFT_455616 [Daedaleopsis nitida]|nr:hypothetical protein C8Q80DRAFT_455616 [Daedaleopsis nitida]